MKTFARTIVAGAFALTSGSAGADAWDDALREVVMRPPRAFRLLTPPMRAQLETMHCTIPQPWGRHQGANVISGHFGAPGQTDVAVLCSRNGESRIVVFWGGPARCPSALAPSEDRSWLQAVSTTQIGYSREILPASLAEIARHRTWYGGPEPAGPPKDGIDDAFVEKASIVHYCVGGTWQVLTGAD